MQGAGPAPDAGPPPGPEEERGSGPELWGVAFAGGALAAAVFSLALAVPVLGLVAAGAGLPLALARLRSGRAAAGLGAALAALAVGTLFSPGQALVLLAGLAAPALLIAEALAAGRGILVGTAWATALIAVELSSLLLLAGPELAEPLTAPLAHYRSDEFGAEMREQGVPEEQVEALREQFGTLERALRVVYPAAYLILGGLLALVNGALLRIWLARRGPHWLAGQGFEALRLPLGVVVVFVASGLAVVSPPLRPFAYNALLLVGFLFALQGLAVLVFFTGRMSGPRPLRGAVVLLVLLVPLGVQLLALVGLLDNFFNFRRWGEPTGPDPAAPGAE